jgi:hypothetical protein
MFGLHYSKNARPLFPPPIAYGVGRGMKTGIKGCLRGRAGEGVEGCSKP